MEAVKRMKIAKTHVEGPTLFNGQLRIDNGQLGMKLMFRF